MTRPPPAYPPRPWHDSMDLCLCWMQPIARLVYAVSTAGGLSWTPLWKTDSQPTKRPSKELFQLALHSRACASCTSQSPPPELPPNQRPAALFVVASSPPPTLSSLDALDPSPDLLLASPLQEEARNLNLDSLSLSIRCDSCPFRGLSQHYSRPSSAPSSPIVLRVLFLSTTHLVSIFQDLSFLASQGKTRKIPRRSTVTPALVSASSALTYRSHGSPRPSGLALAAATSSDSAM